MNSYSKTRLEEYLKTLQAKNEEKQKLDELNQKRRNLTVEHNREKTKLKLQILKQFNDTIKVETEDMKTKILRILESPEFKACIKVYQPQLKVGHTDQNIFEGYRRFNKSPLEIPPDCVEFQAFFMFCSDFNVISANLSKADLRCLLVVIEKLNFQVNSSNVTYLTFEEFIEALFVVSYAQVLLPSHHQLESPVVESLHEQLEQIEDHEEAADGEPTRRISIGNKLPVSESAPALKQTGRKKSVIPEKPKETENDKLQLPKLPDKDISKEAAKIPSSKRPSEQLPDSGQRSHRILKADDEYWVKGINHLKEFLSGLRIPVKRSEAFRLIEEKRRRFSKQEPRYWDGTLS